MKLRILIAVVAMVMMLPANIAIAQDKNLQTPSAALDPVPADGIVGDGDRLIDWSTAEQSDGFRYLIGYRDGRSTLPILIQNTSDEDMVNARMRVTWHDPENSDTKSADESAWVYPSVIRPGEYGFIGGDPYIGSFPKEGSGPIKVYRITSENPDMDARRPLDIINVRLSDTGRLEAALRNSSGDAVEQISLHWVCVERSGLVIIYDWDAINDIRRLNNNAIESISIRVSDDCVDGLLITAEGMAV